MVKNGYGGQNSHNGQNGYGHHHETTIEIKRVSKDFRTFLD